MDDKKVITQKEISEKTGIDRSTLSRYFSGKKVPNLRTANYIASVCELPVTIFISRADQQRYLGKVFLKNDVSYRPKGKSDEQ